MSKYVNTARAHYCAHNLTRHLAPVSVMSFGSCHLILFDTICQHNQLFSNSALQVKQWKLRRKKCLKVNIHFALSFIQKQVIPFGKGEILPIFCYKYFPREKCDFFWRFWPKNWKGQSHNIETFHNEKSDVLEKKTQKTKILWRQPFMLKFGSVRSNQSQSSTPGLPTNGGLVLKYFLSETIHNGSRGTYFAKFLISTFLKGLTSSALE